MANCFFPWHLRGGIPIDSVAVYEQKKQSLQQQLIHARGDIRLHKVDSNLFRNRVQKKKHQTRLEVAQLNQVISIDCNAQTVRVEGMTPLDTLVKETLAHNLMPCVVPELKSITVGGAISGVGIESSSFTYGFVHETVREMEILLSNGETVICSSNNKYKDLFFGIPNSYGTLGYILSATLSVVPVQAFVKLTHTRFYDFDSYIRALKEYTQGNYAFIDGVVFNEDEMYVTLGSFQNTAPYTSNYTFMNMYYQSIQKRTIDYLSIHDYLWRWDTDWFWCSSVFGVQHPIIRFLTGRWTLHSRFYLKLKRIEKKIHCLSTIKKIGNIKTESIIQDVEIPIEKAVDYLRFHFKNIPVRPVWICPMKSSSKHFDLYRTKKNALYVNFGFWKIISSDCGAGYYNKQIEDQVERLEGRKSLYSESYYSKDTFWRLYNKKVYDRLKAKYDPQGKLKNLFEKCVLKQ